MRVASLHGSQQEMIKNLVDRIRDLESDNLTLRRSIPHLRDADGKNVSDEVQPYERHELT